MAQYPVRIFLALVFALPTGCAAQPSEEERRAACDALVAEYGTGFYSVADTRAWRAGPIPLWATPAEVRNTFGEPDSTGQSFPWTDALRSVTYGVYGEEPWFHSVGDSLAYPIHIALDEESVLETDRGQFQAGATAAELAAAFPESYECRNWPLMLSLNDTDYDTELFVDDASERGRIVLWLREGRLRAVGVWDHWPSADLRVMPEGFRVIPQE